MSPKLPTQLLDHLAVHLRLGRVSNLPTVWSNCIAAGALAGIAVFPTLPTLPLMMLSMSFLYVGGMYLNDACDAEIDAAYLRNRPIPLRQIRRTTVYVCAFVFLGLGLLILLQESWRPFCFGLILVIVIIVYNLTHTRLPWSPVLLGLCRMLIYITVGFAAGITTFNLRLIPWSIALACYVVGFSYIARAEETNVLKRFAPLLLLFIPPALNLYPTPTGSHLGLSVLFLAYVGLCLFFVILPKRRQLRLAVSGLIAGIALVDLLAASQATDPILWMGSIFVLFILTHVFQHFIPGT